LGPTCHYLLNGEGEELQIQVGPNNVEEVDRIAISTGLTLNTETLDVEDLAIETAEDAREALDPINGALEAIAEVRGIIGAGEARLSTTTRSLMQYEENVSGAFSQIRDADMARETSEYAKFNILNQASVAVLAQANQMPALALKLLG
jgi:flagellin